MDAARLKIETAILERNFPGAFTFRGLDGGSEGRLEISVRTSAGTPYGLWIGLRPDYPSSLPDVYVSQPLLLRDFRGRDLLSLSPSHEMHLLKPKGRHLQLCHYKASQWHPNVTLYKVVLKCLIWLEAYENHLQSGRPPADYLSA